jgi:hypothetical protein
MLSLQGPFGSDREGSPRSAPRTSRFAQAHRLHPTEAPCGGSHRPVRVRRLSILAFSSELYWNLTQNSVLRFADVWVFGIAFSWLRQPHSETKIFLRFFSSDKPRTRADSRPTEVGAVRSSSVQRLGPYCLGVAPTELSLKPGGGQQSGLVRE